MQRKIKVKLIADWQDISINYDEPECEDLEDSEYYAQGIYIDNEFVNLDIFARYGTMWTGSAPEAEDENGNAVSIHGVSTDLSYPYLIEVNDASQQIRVWKETDAWYSGENNE